MRVKADIGCQPMALICPAVITSDKLEVSVSVSFSVYEFSLGSPVAFCAMRLFAVTLRILLVTLVLLPGLR